MQPGQVSPDSEERAKHRSAILSLSEQHHLPEALVADMYELELERLRQDALITAYLPIFVSRRVAGMLRQLASAASTQTPGGSSGFAR